MGLLLLTLALLLGATSSARAVDCSEVGGVIDGFAGDVPPSQLQIDQTCTIRNFPASNPLSTNFSFLTQPGQTDERWLIVFDNVVHTGQMACNSVAGHKIWFVNGSSSSIQEGCQNLLIPVEKIDKRNPAGQTAAAIGVPFTYTLTIPVLFDPATGSVIDSEGSQNDLHSVVVTDDLNATGVDLTYLNHIAYWEGSPGTPVPHSFSNVNGLLTFDVAPVVPKGAQIVLEITVLLEDTPANSPGTQFVNTAKWEFGRLIDDVFYQPLPGEWGISQPLTVAAPELVVTKTGPAALNLGEWGDFIIDVQNTGLTDAWNATILDQLPDGTGGGMCETSPLLTSARIFEADGTTPVSGVLVPGIDFSQSFAGAPVCELSLTLLTPASRIGPGERLIIEYQSLLDADTQNTTALTNIAGATRWFNGDSSSPERVLFARTLTDGSVGVVDHEDAHTIAAALSGYFFEKTVENLTSGASPATTAAPGDRLRYTLRLQATDADFSGVAFQDDLGTLNPSVVFATGSLALVSVPTGANATNTNPSGGVNGAGILDVRGLNVSAGDEIRVLFDITLAAALADGTLVTNQADLVNGVKIADSDDPNVNGQASPGVVGDEDPTQLVIATVPAGPLVKENTQATASVGEAFRYRITIPETPSTFPIYDVRITDDLTASTADMRFLGVTKVQGSEPWTPINTGTGTNLIIEDPAIGIDIPAGEQVVVEISVVLEDTATNTAGLTFTNTASYTYGNVDGTPGSPGPGDPDTTEPMTIVEPELTLEKSGPGQMRLGVPETFTLDVHNVGGGSAWNAILTDRVPDTASGGTCDGVPAQVTAQIFEADGVTPAGAPLTSGSDFTSTFQGSPVCLLTIEILSAAGTVGPDQRLRVGYETLLDGSTQDGVTLTNVAGATRWLSGDGSPLTAGDRRELTRTVTDGTVGTLDHEDAHSLITGLPLYLFEKTVTNVTSGESPATTAMPGDTLRYRLRLENQGPDPLTGLAIFDELDRLNAPSVFQPGTLRIVSAPAGADTTQTSDTGGFKGTGVLDVRALSLMGPGDSLVVEFEIALRSVIADETVVANQSELRIGAVPIAMSDDPNLNGPADPLIQGDEDPTVVSIDSAPVFLVQKTSTDVIGDPAVLLPGETLRYTITVKNVGTANAVDATLRDAVPVNTQYVTDSTTLNGAPVPDDAAGTSPLIGGILISAPENPTPGAMRADASGTVDNVSTLVFEVVVDPGAIDGTVISNQAFVSAILGEVSDQPSDDPSTPTLDDPTRDVVGDAPLLFAPKSAALVVDQGTPGVVDPGDVLHYTIEVLNSGSVAATNVVLSDAVPANTTYVEDSTTLNGLPVGRPDGGNSPLVGGIPISSSDLAPPGAGGGTLSPGQSAVVEFDLEVDTGVPGGTLISNQAVVTTEEVSDLLTDGDGNPATGPEPTVVVVGDGQQLTITKQVSVVGGGPALVGSELEYLVSVQNIGAVPALDVVITDDLDLPASGQLVYVPSSATLNGSATGITVAGRIITADYSGTYGSLPAGGSVLLRFRAEVDPNEPMGSTVTNIGTVSWNTTQTASASVSVDVGGTPGVGLLAGSVWHDANFDVSLDGGEVALEGWSVELWRNGASIQSVLTDAAGAYSIGGVPPNDVNGDVYELHFQAPGAGARTAALGRTDSSFTNGMQLISDVIVPSGANLQDLNLPIQPNGVVYDAILRAPIPGATLTLLAPGGNTALPTSCLDDSAQQGQVTRADGYYKFDLNFRDPACPSGSTYVIAVAPPGAGFVSGYSRIIPPASDPTNPLSVPLCPGSASDAVGVPAQYCEAQVSEFAPAIGDGESYYVHLSLDGAQPPGTSQIFNNHIPLDPVLDGAVAITKTTPSVNVSRGQLVPYEITLRNDLGVELPDLSVVDRFPAGFQYVDGSARVDGEAIEPERIGRDLTWTDLGIAPASTRTLQLLLAVGSGVSEGEYVNRAQAVSGLAPDTPLSGEATATVRVVPDPTFDCTDVIGKVFDDADHDGVQDRGEKGLPGARLVTARGLIATTDPHGRFHITCAVVPREDRGSNFVLKLDDRSLPSGYRMTTRQTQIKRATRGKALRFDYGASIQRVIGLDLADAVFDPDSAEMRLQWEPRLLLLIEELAKAPAILRLSYVADLEDEALVDRRLEAVKNRITTSWAERGGDPLTIETNVFWRRGAPAARSSRRSRGGVLDALLPSVDAGPPSAEARTGASIERQLPGDADFTRWAHDPALLDGESGDRLEEREVMTEDVRIVKLTDVVPPVRFASGVADIPPSTIQRLRGVLDGMRHLSNVRLHLVGHADTQPLSGSLAGVYGDNTGLSRERAGEVAEFLQGALLLPPEAISFEWTGDRQPIASNATEEGRALNRRVEVEVWYDEIGEKASLEEVVIPADIKRVKICRMETVCKLRFREGHSRRARIQNLIPPLHVDTDVVGVPEGFLRQVDEALRNLADEQNVTVKFIGHTDDAPLAGREERIYGTHLALSKARAHRVALAIREALGLPSAAIASDGRGAAVPVASNQTERGRALNHRIEVEFWHDDSLQALSDDPQPCPDAGDAEVVTRVYDPPWGPIEPIQVVDGEAVIPSGHAKALSRAMDEVSHETNVRLRFVGYTGNQRLERRTAAVYGDDVGLSTARARRVMETLRGELGLEDSQTEHEGRGYVHASDVVNGGFTQEQSSYVVAQVVYDELAWPDDLEGVAVTPITREIRPKDPLELNLMRITVDGEPIDDPARSSADIQRCTDVALDQADIQFRFDGLRSQRRLSVTSQPTVSEARVDGSGVAPVRFQAYSNYPHFIARSEIRVFDQGTSLQSDPLAVIEVGPGGLAEWQPDAQRLESPVRNLEFVLRAYDDRGRFDETAPQSLWMVDATHSQDASSTSYSEAGSDDPSGEAGGEAALLAGYGESELAVSNIDLGRTGSVRVHGESIPPGHIVLVAGEAVPVDEDGRFVAEAILPVGMNTVEVAVLDPDGNGELFLRDLVFDRSEWFYVGIADLTFSDGDTSGRRDALEGNDAPFDPDSHADGRLAFFVTGEFGEDWRLTASADTREEPIEDLFDNFVDKSPESLFRRIDPDYHYPTFGDDGTVEEAAATSGKFYAKLSQRDSHLLWGNFDVGYLDNELAHVDRGLYGANAHFQSDETTSFGERRLVVDGFAAEPGTVASREEFRGTGGSLYWLKHQDLLQGSERLRVEVRDKDTGIVTGVVHLRPTIDYDIDYLQGRVLLSEPVASTVGDQLLVRSQGLSGNEAWLVTQYEYTPGLEDLDSWLTGGQGAYWLNDHVKLGLTANSNEEDDSDLFAGDVTLRLSTETWLKLQAGRTEGLVSSSLLSNDGGFSFAGTDPTRIDDDAEAYQADVSVGISDFLAGGRGRLSLYGRRIGAGYSAPGLGSPTDTDQFGGTVEVPLTEELAVVAKADRSVQDDGLETTSGEVNVAYQLNVDWNLAAGVRNEDRQDESPVVPATQEEGNRTDAVVQATLDPGGRWRGYAFGQATLAKSGDRDGNNRGGIGGAYQVSERLLLDGEVSHGDLGAAAKLGTRYQQNDQTQLYMNYALDNEQAYDGLYARRGNLVTGARSRLSDSSSVYLENRFQHTDTMNGLTRSIGMSLAPSERWNLGANWETGTLIDRQTNAETERHAGGGRVGYAFDRLQIASGIEYRYDETENLDKSDSDRTTWLFRNSMRLQLTPDWRLLGKLNHSFSDSSLGDFYDGDYTEAVIGYAYRPIAHDRLNALAKYTYFYDFPAAEQVATTGTSSNFVQKSHIASLDVTYDLTPAWSVGGKYAFRRSQVSLEREDTDFFDNDAHLYILRNDYRFLKHWEGSVEGRMLHLPDLDERRAGTLVTLYRYLGDHFKVGVGYNFTDFSDDLTDFSYDHHGVFLNLVGSL